MNRSLLGGSNSDTDGVYRCTTKPIIKEGRVTKIYRLGARARKSLLPLYSKAVTYESNSPISPAIAMKSTMATNNSEQTSLLDVMPLDNSDEIEMNNIQLQFPSPRLLSGQVECTEVRVRTDRGDLLVAIQGDRSKPAILTYHDLGLNYMCFLPFFNYVEMRPVLQNFCVYHLTAPGQEEGAPTLPDDFEYPSMNDLASQINYVIGHLGIRSFIGFGVGAGANILARFALSHPNKVEALALINCTSSQAGWIEWGYQKLNSRSLRSRGMTQAVLDYLMWHHFGRYLEQRNHDLVRVYHSHFTREVNPANLSMFIDAYVRRADLGISRDADTIKPPVLNITGALSPHVEDTVTFNGRLHPQNSTWMKISDCAMVLDEQPRKIAEAFRLFLQGEGYVAPLSPTKIVLFRRLSEPGRRRCRHAAVMRITENPISEAVVC